MIDRLSKLELAVLHSVYVLGAGAYGRPVLQKLQAVREGRAVAAGAVYATLDRLERQGLLSSCLTEGGPVRGGRPCRYYQLTLRGASALRPAGADLDIDWRGKEHCLEVFA